MQYVALLKIDSSAVAHLCVGTQDMEKQRGGGGGGSKPSKQQQSNSQSNCNTKTWRDVWHESNQ